jgi:hypothetical protein
MLHAWEPKAKDAFRNRDTALSGEKELDNAKRPLRAQKHL